MKQRAGKRLNVTLDAEYGSSCMAYTGNISENGLYLRIACTEPSAKIRHGALVNLMVELPSGQQLELRCKKIWSNKNTSNSLIEDIGIQIIDPPQDYTYFCQRLMSQKFTWQ